MKSKYIITILILGLVFLVLAVCINDLIFAPILAIMGTLMILFGVGAHGWNVGKPMDNQYIEFIPEDDY